MALLFAPSRPAAVPLAGRDAAALRALLAPSALGDTPVVASAAGQWVVSGPSSCAADVWVAPAGPTDAVQAGPWRVAAASGKLDTLTCSRWRSRLVEVLAADRTPNPVRPGGDVAPRTPFDTALLALAAWLSGAVLLLGSALVWQGGRTERLWAGIALTLCLAPRLLWPHHWTTVYFAWEYFASAHFLDAVPRYGPAGPALWGLALGPLAVDHAIVAWLQIGLYCAGAAAWTLAVRRRAGPYAAAAVLVTQAFAPLWLRESCSESLHVGAVGALGIAAYGLGEAAARPAHRVEATLLAGLALGWAGLFRVDAIPLLWAAAALWQLGTPRGWRGGRWPALLALPTALLGLKFAWERHHVDADRHNLPQIAELGRSWLAHLRDDTLLWRADWLPVGLWLPILAWLVVGKTDARSWMRWMTWLAVAVGFAVVSWLDFNETSLPRLQWPAAHMLAVFAACALGEVLQQRVRSTGGQLGWWSVAVLVAAISSGWTLAEVLRPTIPDAEDALWRRAAHSLPKDSPYWLVTRTYADGPAQGLHLHLPTWLVQSPGGKGRIVSLLDWERWRAGRNTPPVPVYFLRSFRCHAAPRGLAHPGEHPGCRAARVAAESALWELRAPNWSDRPTFAWYGTPPQLDVGLYCLAGCQDAPPAAAR